ncbi:MAG: PQQ-binding-like beta-propeller repeat protein [Planctomycetaceae bacterium]
MRSFIAGVAGRSIVVAAALFSTLTPARGWFQLEKILSKYQAAGEAHPGEIEELPVSFPTSRQMTQDWNSALTLLQTEKSAEALTLLQSILDAEEDSYFLNEARRPVAGSISLKGTVRELLEQLPADMLEQYEVQWGTNADRLWEEYLQDRSKSTLDELVRRYPVTRSGILARERLAAWNFDHREPLAAARLYEALWRSPRLANNRRNTVAVLAAAGWYRGGLSDRAKELLIEAKLIENSAQIVLGGATAEPIADADRIIPWLAKYFGPSPADKTVPSSPDAEAGGLAGDAAGPPSWLLANGSPERNAAGPPGNPLWEPGWEISALLREPTQFPAKADFVQAAWRRLEKKNRREGGLPIPTAQPLIVGDYVLYRTLNHVGAVHLSSGRAAWETIVIDPAADVLIDKSLKQNVNLPSGQSPLERLILNRAWHNITSGTMSSDGEYVYVLDDMGYLRTHDQDRRLVVDPLTPRGYNRLLAFDIRSGKLRWEAGDGRSEVELPLAGLTFLGPPLAVDGRLYCLVLDGSEQLLVVLDARTGGLEWELSLTATYQFPAGAVMTPLDGLSPTLSQGVLICPSGLGAVTAVDLVRRELLWSFLDETAMSFDRLQAADPRFVRAFPPAAMQLPWRTAAYWLDGLAVVEEGRVLLTIPGSQQLSCISLADGELAWSLPHENGLFVGGVADGRVLIVDRHQLRCHWLHDGSSAWNGPLTLTSQPCGRGVRSGMLYYLPMENREILHINLVNGQILTRAAVSDDVALGNLVGAAGMIVSQTPDRVTAFRPLSELRHRVETALKENPNDASALALRGEIRLSQGAEQAGLEDLRTSLKVMPTPRAQDRFVTALTEGLRFDFEKYRRFREEVEPYLSAPVLRWDYMKLYADGLNQRGDKAAAFAEYLKLSDLAGDPSLNVRQDNTLSTPPQTWIRTQLSEVYRSATEDERGEFDREIQRRWETISRKDDPQAFAQFARNFPDHRLADVARKRAVELGKPAMTALEREMSLAALTDAKDPGIAGYAYADWTRLLLDQQRYDETARLFEELEHRFAGVECYPGKTGAALAIAWKLEISQAGAALAQPVNWPAGRIEVSQTPRPQDRLMPYAAIAFDGDPGMFFRNWVLEIDQERTQIRAKDPLGRIRWSLPLDEVNFVIPQYLNGMTAKSYNHLLVINLIHGFLVVDTLESRDRPRVLWQQVLIDPSQDPSMTPGVQRQFNIRAGGLRRAQFFDIGRSPLGQVGPINHNYISYQVGRQLFAADTLTGENLWTRNDVPASSNLFGHRDVLVVAPQQGSHALVLDARSGVKIKQTPVPLEYEQLFASGQTMLCWKKIESKNTMYLLDLVTGKNVWEQQFDGNRSIWLVEDDEVAVMNQAGLLTLFRIADGSVRFTHQIELKKHTLLEFLLVRSDDSYLLLTNTAPPENSMQRTFVPPESRTVNGPVCSFERETGKLQWETNIEYQAYDLAQPGNLPIAVFSCRRYDPESLKQNNLRGQFAVLVLDRRTGKIAYQEEWSELRGMVVITPEYDRKRIVLDANLATIVLQFAG